MWLSFIKFWSKVFYLECWHCLKRWILIKGHNCWKHGAIYTIIKLEEDIMVLNNVTKFHKILIKSILLRERTSFQMVNFHKHEFCFSARILHVKTNKKKLLYWWTLKMHHFTFSVSSTWFEDVFFIIFYPLAKYTTICHDFDFLMLFILTLYQRYCFSRIVVWQMWIWFDLKTDAF